MVFLEVLNPSFNRYKAPLTKIAQWLLENEVSGNFCIEVYLVDSQKMDKNVLAYPAPKEFPRPDLPAPSLGEVYLNPNYIKKHGESLLYMFIHGFLHLQGYDHHKKDDRIEMQTREKELLQSVQNEFPELVRLL